MMKGQKGITLVALVITIIVMLILVGVVVTMAIQPGGVIDSAKDAKNQTEEAYNREAHGDIIDDGTGNYININEFVQEQVGNTTVDNNEV